MLYLFFLYDHEEITIQLNLYMSLQEKRMKNVQD